MLCRRFDLEFDVYLYYCVLGMYRNWFVCIQL